MFKKKKKSLAEKTFIKKTKEVMDIAKAPLIKIELNMADGLVVSHSMEAVKLLQDAVGEDAVVDWHITNINRLEKVAKKAFDEYNKLVSDKVQEMIDKEKSE